MQDEELVQKFLFNRPGVFQNSSAFSALMGLGRAPGSNRALAAGAKSVTQQFYGDCNVFFVSSDEAEDKLIVDFKAASESYQLNGRDAPLLETGTFPRNRGYMWDVLGQKDTQIKKSLSRSEGYVELSQETKALYNVPIELPGSRHGVLSIETSDPRNFTDSRNLEMIVNFTELVLFYWSNRRLNDLTSRIGDLNQLITLLRSSKQASENLDYSLAIGCPESWKILGLVHAHGPLEIQTVWKSLSLDNDAFESVCRLYLLRMLRFSNGMIAITGRGETFLKEYSLID